MVFLFKFMIFIILIKNVFCGVVGDFPYPTLTMGSPLHKRPQLNPIKSPELNKNTDSVLETNLQAANYQLDVLFGIMKSFVYDSVLDLFLFESQYESIYNRLMKIKGNIDEESAYDQPFYDKFKFSYNFLRVMKDTAESLQFFTLEEGLAQKLIHKVIQLKLKLWTLHNSQGLPDPSIKDYGQIVFRSSNLLTTWCTMFLDLPNVPLSLILAFKIYFKEAKDLLEILIRYVP